MTRHGMTRIAAVLVGAAVLFVLEQRLGIQLYIAVPAGIFAYFAALVGLGLLLGADAPRK
jgi:uncharacterized membrane protein